MRPGPAALAVLLAAAATAGCAAPGRRVATPSGSPVARPSAGAAQSVPGRERLACADVARGLAAAAAGASRDTVANAFADAVADATGQTATPAPVELAFLRLVDRLDLDPATVRARLGPAELVRARCGALRRP